MKKYLYSLLFMAVALFSAATIVSCGDDDDVDINEPIGKSIAKTTWSGKTVYAAQPSTVTISFSDGTNGIVHREGKLLVGGRVIDGEAFAKFTYTFSGKIGKAEISAITLKSGKDMLTETPGIGDESFEFIYDSSNNTISLSEIESDAPIILKRVSYQKIKWIEEKR